VRRREFLGVVATFPWTLAARAQQPAVLVVGFLRSSPLADATEFIAAFHRSAGRRLRRRAERPAVSAIGGNQPERLAALLAELIHRPVGVIVGNAVAMLAAKYATATVPIVSAAGGNPVRDGLVASLAATNPAPRQLLTIASVARMSAAHCAHRHSQPAYRCVHPGCCCIGAMT
jgi:putative ABC transport system substrate-binding protein